LLDLSPSAGILANVGAINASMSQNGTDFDDVIDAIRELRDDIKNMKTVVNQIDGVTYDDGSNIASAIEQIVRAVITERRR
jgi:methyl coenzyme M reductase gamma subunit